MLKELKEWLYTPKEAQLLKPVRYVKDKSLKTWLIQIFFILIALTFCASYFFNKSIFESDEMFHILRLKDVGLAIIHGHLPQFNLYTDSPLGIATNTFYSYLLLSPFALLATRMTLMHVTGIIVGTLSLVGLEVCYFCFRKILNYTKLASFIIAICMWFSTVMVNATVAETGDFGATCADIFIPVVFIGWLTWINNNKWRMMVFGLLGMIFSNEPTAMIMILILSILTIFNIQNINMFKIKQGVKAIVVCILSSLMYTLPIIVLQCTNKIYYPSTRNIRKNINPSIIPQSVSKWILPIGYNCWDILEIIILVLIIIYWKKISKFDKQLSILSILLILINIHSINSFLIAYTPLYIIQTCNRFTIFSAFFLAIVLVNVLNYIFQNTSRQDLWQGAIYFVLLIHAFWLLIIPIRMNTKNYSVKLMPSTMYNVPIKKTFNNTLYTQRIYKSGANKFNKNTLHTSMSPLLYPDYLPQQCLRFYNHHFYYSTKVYYNNGFNFKHIKQSKYIKIPLVQYHTQKYIVRNNNKPIRVQYDEHFTKVKLHKGNNRIRVTTPIMWYRYIGLLGTIIGIIGLCYKPKKDKND